MKTKNLTILIFSLPALLFFSGCAKQNNALPYLGERQVVNGDTLYHRIPDFHFIDQDSQTITPQTFTRKIYIADFFFTSCPSICPKVKKQMLRIYDSYREDDRLLILSHSIDTRRDSVPRLKVYAQNLEVSGDKWHFVTGNKDSIFNIANAYFVSAMEDPSAPGGFDHSGRIILVDKDRHVRSWCNGTDPEDVDRFMDDIEALLDEEY